MKIDYKTMYYSLFNTLSDVIELLKKAQEEGERFFIEEEPPELELIKASRKDS